MKSLKDVFYARIFEFFQAVGYFITIRWSKEKFDLFLKYSTTSLTIGFKALIELASDVCLSLLIP